MSVRSIRVRKFTPRRASRLLPAAAAALLLVAPLATGRASAAPVSGEVPITQASQPAPAVLPSLREWHWAPGTWRLTAASRNPFPSGTVNRVVQGVTIHALGH